MGTKELMAEFLQIIETKQRLGFGVFGRESAGPRQAIYILDLGTPGQKQNTKTGFLGGRL
jgi:hypothetical protein